MQPTLAELTHRFLAQPQSLPQLAEVEPHDNLTAFRLEPLAAWQESVWILTGLGRASAQRAMPAEWASFVRQQPAVRYLTMAAGHFPQMVSDLAALLEGRGTDLPNRPPESITTVLHDQSEAFALNEKANQHWRSGDLPAAVAVWNAMPPSPVRTYNLGVALLAMGALADASPLLQRAAAELPADSGWKALAELYLALCQATATPAKSTPA